jgi:hypothetical protein
MKPIDFAKAAGVALLLLVLNVLFSIPVILVYRFFIETGHPSEFYDQAAMRIAPWCSYIIGTALFFIASFFLAKRRPERNGFLFAATFTGLYAFIDAATIGFVGINWIEFVSVLAKLLAALAGAFLATRNRKNAS